MQAGSSQINLVKVQQKQGTFTSTIKDLIAGSVAGIVICLTGHPMDTLKVRLQLEKNETFFKCIKEMYQKEGILSFYKGLESPLVTVPLINAIIFGAYELYKKLFQVDGVDKFTFLGGLNAGMFAGSINCIVIGPIELVKCKLQIQKEKIIYKGPLDCFNKIYRQEGIRGIYKGMFAIQLREIPAYGAQFASYDFYKSLIIKYINKGQDISHLQILFGGGFGGIVSWVVSYPQDIIKTKIQCETSSYKGIDGGFFKVGKQIIKKEGFKGLWRGFSACFIRAFFCNSLGFVAYEQSKKLLNEDSYHYKFIHTH